MNFEKTVLVDSFEENLNTVLEYAEVNNIDKILVFTKNGNAAIEAKKKAGDKEILAVSFPANEMIFVRDETGKVIEKKPESSLPEVRKNLKSKGIDLLLGSMPFEDIVIPGSTLNISNIIDKSLKLVDEGLSLCVQSVLMATDSGYVLPGEKVISMIDKTSVDIISANKRFLFHPQKGLKINNIICKKRR